MTSVFATPDYNAAAYPYQFRCTINTIVPIAGGVPTDPKVAEGWIKRIIVPDNDDLVREAVAEVMVQRGVTAEEAIDTVIADKHLNGFKRDEHGLYIEGRQMKACIKEAASAAAAVGKLPARWGKTNKGVLGFVAEHIFVTDVRLHLGVSQPSGIAQKFVSTFRGNAIQYEEYVEDAKMSFTVIADYDFSAKEWAMLWRTAEQQGIGASRSQGYGRFEVVEWDRLTA